MIIIPAAMATAIVTKPTPSDVPSFGRADGRASDVGAGATAVAASTWLNGVADGTGVDVGGVGVGVGPEATDTSSQGLVLVK